MLIWIRRVLGGVDESLEARRDMVERENIRLSRELDQARDEARFWREEVFTAQRRIADYVAVKFSGSPVFSGATVSSDPPVEHLPIKISSRRDRHSIVLEDLGVDVGAMDWKRPSPISEEELNAAGDR